MCPGVPQTNSSSRSLTSCASVIPKWRAASASGTPCRRSSQGTMASSRDSRRGRDAHGVVRAHRTAAGHGHRSPAALADSAPGRRAPAQPPDHRLPQIGRLEHDDVRPVPGQLLGEHADLADPASPSSSHPGSGPGWQVARRPARPRRSPAPAPGTHPQHRRAVVGRVGACRPTIARRVEAARGSRRRRAGRSGATVALDPGQPEHPGGAAVAVDGRPRTTGRSGWSAPTAATCRSPTSPARLAVGEA